MWFFTKGRITSRKKTDKVESIIVFLNLFRACIGPQSGQVSIWSECPASFVNAMLFMGWHSTDYEQRDCADRKLSTDYAGYADYDKVTSGTGG